MGSHQGGGRENGEFFFFFFFWSCAAFFRARSRPPSFPAALPAALTNRLWYAVERPCSLSPIKIEMMRPLLPGRNRVFSAHIQQQMIQGVHAPEDAG